MNEPQDSLSRLDAAAQRASAEEAAYRQEASQRIATLERRRAFAFRRANLIRAIVSVMADCEDETTATAAARAALRGHLGWEDDSDARLSVLSRFDDVARAIARHLELASPQPTADTLTAAPGDIDTALADFENWHEDCYGTPFWSLFDRYVTETPLVDF